VNANVKMMSNAIRDDVRFIEFLCGLDVDVPGAQDFGNGANTLN
jgi:hypothetical protein